MIDVLDFQVLGHIGSQASIASYSDKLISLKYRAHSIVSALEYINTNVLQKFRENIITGKYRGKPFKEAISKYIDINSYIRVDGEGYDNLDLFINGLFPNQIPEQTQTLLPEMVFYQKTPARIVFEIAEKIAFTDSDMFYDMGSGLGQVDILLNLLTGITTKGVEFEPAFCQYATDCAKSLNLTDVSFINTDARNADYADGTVFFLYTPFRGEMLREVLDKLKQVALYRKITIITYGPCTIEVATLNWLQPITGPNDSIYKLAVFNSY